jgi:protein-glutamine gamma-glutamyltransferase
MIRADALDLPRLAGVLASVAFVMAPHAARVPAWTAVFCAAVLLLRLYLGWRHRALPPRWILFGLAVAAIAGVVFSYRTVFGRDSGVVLLLAMAALKLLEMRSTRDVNVVMVLCYFLAITNFFYTQTIPTAIYSIAAVWLITATLVALQHSTTSGRLGQIARTSGMLLAQSIPLMLLLFMLFPRIQGPLWGLPQIQHSARSGLSETMSPGSLSQLSLSDEIAFRVQFETLPPNVQQMYWRGPVMWDFDGRTWSAGQPITLSAPRYESLSPPLSYTVTMEPHEQRWLFLADLPSRLPPSSVLTRDYQVLSFRPVRERLRYAGESVLQYRVGAETLRSELLHALALPPGAAPQARELAQQWRSESAGPREIVQRALQMYGDQPFLYTLEPPPLDQDPVDQFLFETRAGFCEHYASSFAVLMRAAGVPARVVTGYLGGEVNPVDEFLIVRQSEAHAWTEVWIDGEGWIRVDPTAAVSPLRIQQGLASAVPETDTQPLMRRTRLEWIKQVRHTWDAVTNSWNQWVLGYTPDQQSRFLTSLGLDRVSWQQMVAALVASTGVLLLGFAAAMLWRLRRGNADPVQRAWLRYGDIMAKRGLSRRSAEGPMDFTARALQRFPEESKALGSIGELYVRLRYGADPEAAMVRELRAAIDSLR